MMAVPFVKLDRNALRVVKAWLDSVDSDRDAKAPSLEDVPSHFVQVDDYSAYTHRT
jgi:hypothetical protein